MTIAILAHDSRKELALQFCTAYKSVLMKHNLFATATTGRLIADNTGLPITLLLSHKQGGHQQINARIAYNEIDLVLLFTDPNTTDPWDDAPQVRLLRAEGLGNSEQIVCGCERIFSAHSSVSKTGNTQSIPPFPIPRLDEKSRTHSPCRFIQSFLDFN